MSPLGVALGAAPSPLWYASRGSGMVSLVLLTATMVLGTLTTVRWSSPRWPRFLSQDLHRDLSLLVIAFLCLHILTSVLDPFAHLRLVDAVVPFAASYRPLWLGLGVVSTDLLLALVVTSIARRRIKPRSWRVLHWAAYACWPVAVIHGLGTGTDTRAGWSLLLTSACVIAVLGAGVWRLGRGWPVAASLRVAVGLAAGIVVVGGVAWTATGPLSAGWARRAGTPTDLLAGIASRSASLPPVTAAVAPGLDLTLSGTQFDDGSTTTVRLDDGGDPPIAVTLAAGDQSSAASLVITRGGESLCSTTATVGQQITAVCGSVPVQLSLQGAGGSAVTGRLSSGMAP